MITLTEQQWTQIRKQLKAEYGWKPSVLLIRETMRRELGFTTRQHTAWSHTDKQYEIAICLDFYDDAAETFFRMKYL